MRCLRNTYKFDIGTHLRNLPHLYHDELVNLRIPLFVVSHGSCYEVIWSCAPKQCLQIESNCALWPLGHLRTIHSHVTSRTGGLAWDREMDIGHVTFGPSECAARGRRRNAHGRAHTTGMKRKDVWREDALKN